MSFAPAAKRRRRLVRKPQAAPRPITSRFLRWILNLRLAVVRTTIWCVAPQAAALFGVEFRIIPSLHTKIPEFFLSFIKPWHNGEAHIGTGSGVNIIIQHCELICPCRSLCVAHNGRSGITRNDTIIAIIARIAGDRNPCQRINLGIGIAGIALTAAA